MENEFFQKYIDSPLGVLRIKTSNDFLMNISFVSQYEKSSTTQPDILKNTEIQLKEYFEGIRKIFPTPVKSGRYGISKRSLEVD